MRHFIISALKKICLPVLAIVCSTNLVSAQNSDSKGTDFWLTFPGNLYTDAQPSLFISGEHNTSGTVTIPGVGFSQNFTITIGNVTTVDLPSSVFLDVSDVINDNGIHVTAAKEVTIYGLNRREVSTDAYLGLPTDILGTEYINLSYFNSVVNGTQFGIVATKNTTTVTITPTATTNGHAAGVSYNITLDQGQTYLLRNIDAYPSDLTGSVIQSDKPIGVFGSHSCANVPAYVTYCDHIVEELPPLTAWGKNFVTVPLKTRLNGDTFRFIASENNTKVSVDGSVVANLDRGQTYETILAASSQIISTKPILVAQYSNGTSYDGIVSDPFMMLIPPYEQFLGEYTITTPATGFPQNFVNVVAPNAAVGNIKLDGVVIPAAQFTQIGSSGFSGAQVDISLGVHNFRGAGSAFGVFVYGFADFDSYGYPGGQSLSPVATVNSLALTPENGSAPINTSQCFTALVKDQFDEPVVGVRVDFVINGANGGTTGFENTDANGEAEFCYDGPNAGLDTIIATVSNLSDTSYFTRTSDECDLSLSFTKTNVSCYGYADGSIDLTVSGGTKPNKYKWSNGATTQDLNNIPAGTYTVTVKDKNKCAATIQVKIKQPQEITFSLIVENVSCQGGDGSVMITAAGGTPPYTYTLGGVTNTSGVFENLGEGTYPFTVTDANNCSKSDSVTLTQGSPIETAVAVVNASCYGSDGSVTITATGGTPPYTYTLDGTTNTTGIFTGLSAGTYHYKVTDAAGCKVKGTATVESTPPVKVCIKVSGCIFGWGGFYILFLTDQNPYPEVTLTALASGGSGNYSYEWSNGKHTKSITVTPQETTTYHVTVTDDLGCKKTECVLIVVIDLRCDKTYSKSGETMRNNQIMAQGKFTENSIKRIKVYPNPAYSYINVEYPKAKLNSHVEAEIINMDGKVVLMKPMIAESNNRIDISSLPPGLYILNTKVSHLTTSSTKFTIIR